MSRLAVKKEFSWNKIGSWKNGDPYTITFVYPKNNKPFALKGGANDVEGWLEDNMANVSYVAHHTWFCSTKPKKFWPRTYMPLHRRRIRVNLVSDKYIADISKEAKRVEIGEGPHFGCMRYKYLRDGYSLTVLKKDESKWRNRGEEIIGEKKFKRVPRCFPKELEEFCDD